MKGSNEWNSVRVRFLGLLAAILLLRSDPFLLIQLASFWLSTAFLMGLAFSSKRLVSGRSVCESESSCVLLHELMSCIVWLGGVKLSARGCSMEYSYCSSENEGRWIHYLLEISIRRLYITRLVQMLVADTALSIIQADDPLLPLGFVHGKEFIDTFVKVCALLSSLVRWWMCPALLLLSNAGL